MSDLDFLRSQINELCGDIAAKFDVCDSRGRPRRAFILDTLMKYSCIGCIAKAFTQKYENRGDVDAIYRENHRLAVKLLTDHLQSCLNEEGFNILVQDEVEGNYGRFDVLVRPINCGVLLKIKGLEIIIEIKTGKGLSYDQIFRYLIDKPNATIIVWRVIMRQIFAIDQKKTNQLLLALLKSVIRRGTKLLNEDGITPCHHNLTYEKVYTINDPQKLIDDFTLTLSETLPEIIDKILHMLKTFESVSALQ